MQPLSAKLATLATVLVLLLAACAPPPTSTSPPLPTATAIPQPTATPTPQPTPSPVPTATPVPTPSAPAIRTATRVVCASDAPSKAQCDYVADGADDQVEIQKALDGLPPLGGRVYLSEGAFYLNNQPGKDYAVRLPPNSEKAYVVLEGAGKRSTILRYSSSKNGDHMLRVPSPGIDEGLEIANMQWEEWDRDCDDEPPKLPCPRWAKALAGETPKTVMAKFHVHDLYVRRWGTGIEVGVGYWGNWHDIRFQATRTGLDVLTEFNVHTLVNIMATGTTTGLKLRGYGITVIGSDFMTASNGVGIWLLEGDRITLIGSSGEANRGATNTVDLRVEAAVTNSSAIGFNADSGVDIRSPSFAFTNSRNYDVQAFFPESLPPLERWQNVDLANGWKEAERTGTASSSAGQTITVSTGTTPHSKVIMKQDVFGLAPGDYAKYVNWDKPIYILMNLYKTGNDPEGVGYIQLTQATTYGDLAAPGVGLKIANLDLQGDAYRMSGDTFPLNATLSEGKDVEVLIAHIPAYGVVYMVNGEVKASRPNRPGGTPSAEYGISVAIGNGSTGGVNNSLVVYRMRVYSGK